MKLPFVDEIRDARARADDARRAAGHLGRIDGCIQALGMLERHHQLHAELPDQPLPGEDLIQEIADSWPALADLPSATPRAGEPVSLRLQARRAQLEMARATLKFRSTEAAEHGRVLHELQHRQHDALEEPRWADATRELASLRTARDAVAAELQPIDHRVAVLRPVRGVVDPLAARLRAELAHREDPDLQGLAPWRALHLARAILESVAGALPPSAGSVPLPPAPSLPAAPSRDPAVNATLWWDVEGVSERLDELTIALAEDATRLAADHQRLLARLDELDRSILERTG